MSVSVKIKRHLQVLEQLGITGLNHEIESMTDRVYSYHGEENSDGWDITTNILSYAGMGHFDSHMRSWRPSSDTVYSFDSEILNPGKMYTFFLQGLAAINKNEFHVSALREYEAAEDDTHKVHFMYNKKNCEFIGRSHGDWFDFHILNYINDLLEEHKSSKRFYFLVSGCQMLVLFYNTPEWADKFMEELGYPIYSKVNF